MLLLNLFYQEVPLRAKPGHSYNYITEVSLKSCKYNKNINSQYKKYKRIF